MDLHHLPRLERYVDSNNLSPWLNSTPSDQRAVRVRKLTRNKTTHDIADTESV
jgi:hypothetical protein